VAQVADELQYAAGNAPETLLPSVLQLLASLLEFDRKALRNSLPGATSCRQNLGFDTSPESLHP
jgi:hypothetical protein